MTSVRMLITREAPTGRVGVPGTLRCAPTRARTVAGDPDETVLPAPMVVEVGPTGRADVSLAATGPSWCWHVSWRSAAGSWDEWVAVPESAAPLDWPDLVRVDPATLAPTAAPEAAWDLALAETRAVADAAKAASIPLASVAADEQPAFGAELVDGSGWTLSTGWTGSYATGFAHAATNTGTLSRAITVTPGTSYQVRMRLTPTCQLDGGNGTSDFSVTLGGSTPFATYRGSADTRLYDFGIVAGSGAAELVITPEPRYAGVVTEVSVRQITGALPAVLTLRDSTGAATFEVRPTVAALENVFLGVDTGSRNTSGYQNSVVGVDAYARNASGFWNSGVGYLGMAENTVGSRNCWVGFRALTHNISGHRNVAIGSFALEGNTHGANNIGIGADAVWQNKDGSGNIGIGLAALAEITTGADDNIAVGIGALGNSMAGDGNIAIGRSAGNKTSGNDSIAIGRYALLTNVTPGAAAPNIAIGASALAAYTAGSNLAVGHEALKSATTGERNVGIGNTAGDAITTGASNVGVGFGCLSNVTTGSGNVGIGTNAGNGVTTKASNTAIGENSMMSVNGERNVAVGTSSMAGAAGSTSSRNVALGYTSGVGLAAGADYNVLIGASCGVTLTSGASNILIGYNVQASSPTVSNELNIGGAIFGNLSAKRIGLASITTPTARLHLPAGAVTASGAPLKIDAGTLLTTPEAGAVEFDGTSLYFTTAAGVRKTLAVVA